MFLGLAPVSSSQKYPTAAQQAQGLDGCIRNLHINGDQYDLATPAFER